MNDPEALETALVQALGMFAETLANPKPMTARLIEAWVLAIEGELPVEKILPTAKRLLKSERFFPTPADFLRVWAETPEETIVIRVLPGERYMSPLHLLDPAEVERRRKLNRAETARRAALAQGIPYTPEEEQSA